jgi:hypothetical protein
MNADRIPHGLANRYWQIAGVQAARPAAHDAGDSMKALRGTSRCIITGMASREN